MFHNSGAENKTCLDHNGFNCICVEMSTYKPISADLQPFRQHHHVRFVSEGARPANRNKRAAPEHPPEHRPSIRTSQPFSPNSDPYSRLPDSFDVSPGLRDAEPLSPGRAARSRWEPEHAAFINSKAGFRNEKWVGKRPLGFGGFGTAGLWELRDNNDNLLKVL